MDTLKHSAHSAGGQKLKLAPTGLRSARAFSLVEITVAIGIVAFAFMGILGLIPVGLNTYRKTIDLSVGSNIAQKVIREAQQTDFSTLVGANTAAFQQSATPRYFDEQGTELTTATDGNAKAIYQVNTCINPSTPIIGTNGTNNPNLATVTVQIANNPANINIDTDATTQLWKDSRVSIATYSALVSRNK